MSPVLLALALSVSSLAAPPPPPPPPPTPAHEVIAERAADLGIDAQTAKQIVTLAEAERDNVEALQQQLEDARADLHDLLEAEEPVRAEVMAAIDHLGSVETELHKTRVGVLLEIRALLTPEQREAVRAFGGGGPGGDGPPPPPPGGGPPPPPPR